LPWAKLYVGDAVEVMKTFESESIDLVITSPPYWGHRDYGIKGQIGLEASVEDYIQKIVSYFHELKRVLKSTGSFYLNMGDTYSRKNLLMIPARVALALQNDGWVLRNDIIWFKPNHMPSSVKDRLTNTYEHLFHFVKTRKYYYDLDSIRIPHKTGPAQFNYRVREAKKGNFGILGVKSSMEEMEQYDSKGQKVRGLKTKGKARIGQEQHHGQDVNYHPNGKNPGDVELYNTKFDERSQAKRLGENLAYARKVLGKGHETALNHPLGKNPGDILFADSRGKLGAERKVMQESGYIDQHSGYMLAGLKIKSRLGIDIKNPMGKNPGDVFYQEQHPKYTGVFRRGERLPPQKDQPNAFNPLGKNPGDVLSAPNTGGNNKEPYMQNNPHRLRLKGNENCTHSRGKNPGDIIFIGQRLGVDAKPGGRGRPRAGLDLTHENHPFGKNPGDVVVTPTGVSGIKYYKQIISSDTLSPLEKENALKDLHGILRKVAKGEVTDFRMVIRGQQKPQHGNDIELSGRAKEIKEKGYVFMIYYPLGKNPGDVMEASARDTNRHHGSGPPNLRHGETILPNPKGKNPGDVMPMWKRELVRTDRPLKPPKGVSVGGGNTRLRQFSKRWRLENQQPSAKQEDRLSIYHPLGRNPGDVIETGNLKYKGQKNIRQDQNLGGNVGLAEFRDKCRASGLTEGHPLGRNPGDVVNLSPETRSKGKLLKERRRELNEMRAKGKIHWEVHPSKDPRWFGNKGKNPTDFWTLTTRGFPGAHFAVYPEALCIRPILSSCPLEVCVKCGKPRQRIIKTHNPGGILGKPGQPQVTRGQVYLLPDGTRSKGGSVYYSGKTIGWSSCDCSAGFEPGIVLDPFVGAGTTMKVALELGRNVIGIELNPNYVEIIKRRLNWNKRRSTGYEIVWCNSRCKV